MAIDWRVAGVLAVIIALCINPLLLLVPIAFAVPLAFPIICVCLIGWITPEGDR